MCKAAIQPMAQIVFMVGESRGLHVTGSAAGGIIDRQSRIMEKHLAQSKSRCCYLVVSKIICRNWKIRGSLESFKQINPLFAAGKKDCDKKQNQIGSKTVHVRVIKLSGASGKLRYPDKQQFGKS